MTDTAIDWQGQLSDHIFEVSQALDAAGAPRHDPAGRPYRNIERVQLLAAELCRMRGAVKALQALAAQVDELAADRWQAEDPRA